MLVMIEAEYWPHEGVADEQARLEAGLDLPITGAEHAGDLLADYPARVRELR